MSAFGHEWFGCVWPFCEVCAQRVNVLIYAGGWLKMGKVLRNYHSNRKGSVVFEFVIWTERIRFWNVNKQSKSSSKHWFYYFLLILSKPKGCWPKKLSYLKKTFIHYQVVFFIKINWTNCDNYNRNCAWSKKLIKGYDTPLNAYEKVFFISLLLLYWKS